MKVVHSIVDAKPFLRWAGGKRKLAPLILEIFDQVIDDESDQKFFDPFLGGGSVPLCLVNSGFSPNNLVISDVNSVLIDVYLCVQRMDNNFVTLLESYERLFSELEPENAYLKIRNEFNLCRDTPGHHRAALFLALNKTNFNGLWRENSSGEYNVPFGHLVNPKVYDAETLVNTSRALRGVTVLNSGFQKSLSSVSSGDMVFLDPPYVPLDDKNSFISYHGSGFGEREHRELASEIARLVRIGANVVLCNSSSQATFEIYSGCGLNIYEHAVGRSIAADGTKRNSALEIIATNLDIDDEIEKDFSLKIFLQA